MQYETEKFGSFIIKLLIKLNLPPFIPNLFSKPSPQFFIEVFLFILNKFCQFLSHYLTLQLQYVLCSCIHPTSFCFYVLASTFQVKFIHRRGVVSFFTSVFLNFYMCQCSILILNNFLVSSINVYV